MSNDDYTFDPTEETGGNGGGDDLPTGIYAMVLKGITIKRSGAGNLYGRARFQVIHGHHEGVSMFTNVMLNVGNEMTRKRLKMLCDAMNVKKRFHANDEDSVMSALGNRPFIASVLRTEEGGYTNHSLKRFVFPNRWSEGHRRVCESWLRTFEDDRAIGGGESSGGGRSDFDDDDFLNEPSTRAVGDHNDFSNDDIPF